MLKFAVIVSKSQGKWVLCKHRERDTYECPGGHRENGEDILTTAKRELYEIINHTCKWVIEYNGKCVGTAGA